MSYGITSKSQIIDYDTIRKACDNLKATPHPAKQLQGYLLSFLFKSITATASGS